MGPRRWLAVLPLLAVCGCADSYRADRATRVLDARLHRSLSAELAGGGVTLQRRGPAVVVTAADSAMFAPGSAEFSQFGRNTLTDLIQGLIAPGQLRLDLTAPATATPGSLAEARVQRVVEALRSAGLGAEAGRQLLPVVGTAPTDTQAMAFTLTVANP